MVQTYFAEHGIECSLMTAVGDDNYSVCNQRVNIGDVSNFMKDWFNMVVSPEKSNVVSGTWEGSHFLGSYLSGEGRATRPLHEVLINLLNPEQTPDDEEPPGLLAERIVSYAYETAGYDLKVYEFLRKLWRFLVERYPDVERHPSAWSPQSLRYWRDIIRDRPPNKVVFPESDCFVFPYI